MRGLLRGLKRGLGASLGGRLDISIASLTENASTTDGSTVATASISPTEGADVYVAVVSRAATAANQPTCTGCGQTWTVVRSQVYLTSDLCRLTVFRARIASASAGALTFDFGGQSQTSFVWHVVQCLSTANPATVQSKPATATAGTSLAVTLDSALENVKNLMLAFHAVSINSTITKDTNFTQLAASRGVAANTISLLAEYAVNQTSCTATFASAHSAAVGIEVKAGP
jgi:hypothetical protein